MSQTVGQQVKAIHTGEARWTSLSDNILPGPGKPVPKMYVCMDGSGVPVVRNETVGRKVSRRSGQYQGSKVEMRFYTQTEVDDKGRSVRDDFSTRYTGSFETTEIFGQRIDGKPCNAA